MRVPLPPRSSSTRVVRANEAGMRGILRGRDWHFAASLDSTPGGLPTPSAARAAAANPSRLDTGLDLHGLAPGSRTLCFDSKPLTDQKTETPAAVTGIL